MVSTITMPVAADSPPTKAASAKAVWPCDKGIDRMKVSGFTEPAPNNSKPPRAMGKTNRLISNRYSGNTQAARCKCRSSTFSTTMT